MSTATWGAAAAPGGGTPAGGPLLLGWSDGGPTATARVDVVVTGRLAISAVTLQLGTEGRDAAGDATVTACLDGTWDGPDCSGTSADLGDLSTPSRVEVPLGPGDRLPLRIEVPRSVANRTAFTLGVGVGRDAVRAGLTRPG